MSRKMVTALLLLYIWLNLTPFIKANGCSKDRADLDSSQLLMITSCSDLHAEKIDHRGHETIPAGSTCEVKCLISQVSSWRECNQNHTWIGPSVNCDVKSDKEIRHRQKRFFRRIFRAIGDFFHDVGCFFTGCKTHKTPPDRTKPTLTCPPDITKVADPFQVNTKVLWTEPTARDETDGTLSATRSGLPPGTLFSEGITTIGYYAKDKSGNMASCTFTIRITVTRCKKTKRQTDGYCTCHPSQDMRRGGYCHIGCYDGHVLEPSISKITCQDSGEWDNIQPSCKKIDCPDILPASPLITISCTDGTKYRSICTYSCAEGYDVPTSVTRVRVCTADGTWKGAEPTCADITPPLIKDCPYSVVGYTGEGKSTGQVYWEKPTVEDNSVDTIEAVQLSGPSAIELLTPGVYTAIYMATDSSGNKAKQCIIKIVMKLISCFDLYPKPYTHVVCPNGTKYGSECTFSCDDGASLTGNEKAICQRRWDDPAYGEWSFSSDQPYCSVVSKCLDLNPPDNGALACDYWLGGRVCTMMCRKGYDVSPRVPFYKHLVCGDSGNWTPASFIPPDLPDCEEIKNPENHELRMTLLYYFDGDCSDGEVIRIIQLSFVELLQQSSFSDWCYEPDCSLGNVNVICSNQTRWRRETRDDFAQYSSSFQIKVSVPIKFDLNDTIETSNIKENSILGVIYNIAENAQSKPRNGSNFKILFDSMKTEPTKVSCPQGSVASKKTGKCVVCPPGTFYTSDESDEIDACQPCPKGQYQPDTAQQNCIQCPGNQTTKQSGTQSGSGCLDGCMPGSWSADGIPPCSSCRIDSYQSTYGATSCELCPGSKITNDEGATSENMCFEFDIVFPPGNTYTYAVLEGLNLTDVETMTVTFWAQCKDCNNPELLSLSSHNDDRIFRFTGWDEFSIDTDGQSLTTDYGIQDDLWHNIGLLVENRTVVLYVDGDVVFTTSSSLFSSLSSVVIGGADMNGIISQLNIWNYRNEDALQGRSRQCFSRESGNLVNWRMLAKANLTSTFLQSPSECDDIDNCLSSPCENGNCTDVLNGFMCTCMPGYTGETCGINIDDCVNHVCQNNASCIDGVMNYNCSCDNGFAGDYCEIATVDGNWGDWSTRTECSVTCGNGTVSRFRVCDNPPPDKGAECVGNDTETEPCREPDCPTCFELEPPVNGYTVCDSDTENDLLSCTIHCNDENYQFSEEPRPHYTCGKATFYTWDFQTDDNPYALLPSCTEKQHAMLQTVSYCNKYGNLFCDENNKLDVVKKVTDTVDKAAEDVNCISSGLCSMVGISVTNCQTSRTKRTVDEVSFSVDFMCDSERVGGDECVDALVQALYTMETTAKEGSLSVHISGMDYQILANSSAISGKADCAPGSVDYGYYCVPCGLGTFQYQSECVLCEYGYYTDDVGQLTCESCPEGKTTLGTGSRSREECVVQVPRANGEDITSTIIPAVCSIVGIIVIVVAAVIFRKCRKTKDRTPGPVGTYY